MVQDLISMKDILILKVFFNSIGNTVKRFETRDKKEHGSLIHHGCGAVPISIIKKAEY
jgi:hypothetical protein